MKTKFKNELFLKWEGNLLTIHFNWNVCYYHHYGYERSIRFLLKWRKRVKYYHASCMHKKKSFLETHCHTEEKHAISTNQTKLWNFVYSIHGAKCTKAQDEPEWKWKAWNTQTHKTHETKSFFFRCFICYNICGWLRKIVKSIWYYRFMLLIVFLA